MEKTRDERTRNWTFLVYPYHSAPENWRALIDELHIPWIESPLHEEDYPEETDSRPHHHIAVMFEGKKSFEQIKEISDLTNSPIPQPIKNMRSMIRYFVHMDQPEKKRYDISELIGHGGADVAEYLTPTRTSRHEFISEMMDFIDDEGYTEFFQLATYARQCRFADWFPLLCDNSAIIMREYIKSKRFYTISVEAYEAKKSIEGDKKEKREEENKCPNIETY